jgi:hypothetical protein
MGKLNKDLSTGTMHPREDFYNITPATLGAANAEVIINADGCSTVSLDLRGTFNMQIEVSGTVDGVNWSFIPMRMLNSTTTIQYGSVIAGSTQGIWVGKCGQFCRVRARVVVYTSGSAIPTIMSSNANLDDSLQGMVTPLLATTTAAVSTVTTLTLTPPGAGLRHYITYLRIVRFASASLTSAATPVLVTTTNIPGALAFTLPAEASAQGIVFAYQEDFSYPLATSAQNTATTIVAPATTGVIWRITAGYYVAP